MGGLGVSFTHSLLGATNTVFAGILPKSSRQERRGNQQQEAETEENPEDEMFII